MHDELGVLLQRLAGVLAARRGPARDGVAVDHGKAADGTHREKAAVVGDVRHRNDVAEVFPHPELVGHRTLHIALYVSHLRHVSREDGLLLLLVREVLFRKLLLAVTTVAALAE